MLEIKNITKIYKTTGFTQTALDGVSVNFRKCEFASILGPSGSGKTTFLNIIGGLDHYDSGDLIINEVSTKQYKDKDWDSYRNHRIGFVFQSYNLIGHQSVLNNVKLALTLSGITKKDAIKMAKEALIEVGLEEHMNKRPNQLSGGQMQRVAIARALVNNPDILLADEPTGALDSKTSIQIMDLLKKIAKKKLVIMVTHNPELAKKYSNRIIKLQDGKIVSDSNPYDGNVNTAKEEPIKDKKTKMSFFTALNLSFNNLMTKKGRTILVSIAGSIGIIGIALIMAVSNGFQNYVDSIQEDTLTSYPLTIMQESTDVTSMLLSMRSAKNDSFEEGYVKEEQYLSTMFANFKANDLKGFNHYIVNNFDSIKNDLSSIKYSYSINPYIYTIDSANNLARINPSNMFSSMFGDNPFMSSYSSMTSIFSQMIDDQETLSSQYDVLKGRWPKEYNEMIIVLSEKGSISDLLLYSLGLRDTKELPLMMTSLMSGESISIENEPLKLSYDDLLNIKLKLIPAVDTYRYNERYNIYEDMSSDEKYMQNLYKNAIELKIVGIVTPKEGTTTMALNPGVSYTSKLIDFLIDYAAKSGAVKKQLSNEEVDVFSGKKFGTKSNSSNPNLSDMIYIDTDKIREAFNIQLDEDDIKNKVNDYINEINNSINNDTSTIKNDISNTLYSLENGLFNSISGSFTSDNIDYLVSSYLASGNATTLLNTLEVKYSIDHNTVYNMYSSLLKSMLQVYIPTYYAQDQSLGMLTAKVDNAVKNNVISSFNNNGTIINLLEAMAGVLNASASKDIIINKISSIANDLTDDLSKQYNISKNKLASAIRMKYSAEQMARIFSTMMNQTESSYKANLLALGYQDIEDPTYISFYFSSFEGKEHFLEFIDEYNESVEEDKVIHYTDATGILMDSVKTIVNAVSYVLIAFVSISLVVSSFMIGIITYISVYERTKEIGILRAIGASKRNISSIFNAETFIIGLLSGLFGIGITYLLIPIINIILHHYAGNIPLNASLAVTNALILITLSIVLTLIGGIIPAHAASKKDPVEALRSE